ncbi:external DNA catabolism protein [Opitutaceae bacterium TAV5]|nr:external DNA catabolism protein [Opitutaceae bacterium TAV5]
MNYRHQFHAGNFADVFKHAALVQLVRFLQRKEKGFLYLDTHAGRGSYDLAAAARGDSLARQPEWPDGIGRLLAAPSGPADPASPRPRPAASAGHAAPAAPTPLADYIELVRSLADTDASAPAASSPSPAAPLRMYPGSPRIVQALLRPQDRMTLCEKEPGEAAALQAEFRHLPRVSVQALDGYTGIRAHLPPPERRALVLIDPPYEAQDELQKVAAALREGVRRLPGGVFAVWYPLTGRAGTEAFFTDLARASSPPLFAVELTVAGDPEAAAAGLSLRGCGLAVLNPPWGIAPVLESLAVDLARLLARHPGGRGTLNWIVPEA